MAIVATAIAAMSPGREGDEEYYDMMVLSETESHDPWERDDGDADWDEPLPHPRRRRRKGAKLPTVKKPKKKRERKDWCERMMRQLEIRCALGFVQPRSETRRGGKV
jgi:hypothetical protein